MTADLVAFLRARLDEAEEDARNAQAAPPPRTPGGWPHESDILAGAARMGVPDVVTGCYLVHGDPKRVLDEVDAKRRIIGYLTHELADYGADNPWWYDGKLIPILRLLALPYARHPDYRPEWAPES
jgi:hypothetical protein